MAEIVSAKLRHVRFIAAAEKMYIDCPWTEAQIEGEIARDDVIFLVAEEDGRAVGYLSGEVAADECEISNVAVDEGYRRRGIARALFKEMEARCAARGVSAMFLLVREDNAAAIALYGAVGFTAVGMRKKYYGASDAIIMRKNI